MQDIKKILEHGLDITRRANEDRRRTVIQMPRAAGKTTIALATNPRSQRDELFDYFYDNLSGPWKEFTKRPLRKAHLAVKISHLSVPDLFYLKSVCEDAERRGQEFSKVFWGSLKVNPDYAQPKIQFEKRGV